VVPANVYGYAALVAYSLHQPSAAPAASPLQNPVSPSFANPLVLLIVSMVIGALFGYASDQLAKVLPKQPTMAAQDVARLGRCFRPRNCGSRQKLVFEYPLPIAQVLCLILDVRQNSPDVGRFLFGHVAVLVEIELLVTHEARSRQCVGHRIDRSD
jgi:hypothetical protein